MAKHFLLPSNTKNPSEYLLFALFIGVLCRPLIYKKVTNLVSFVNETIPDISVMFVALVFVWFHASKLPPNKGGFMGDKGPILRQILFKPVMI